MSWWWLLSTILLYKTISIYIEWTVLGGEAAWGPLPCLSSVLLWLPRRRLQQNPRAPGSTAWEPPGICDFPLPMRTRKFRRLRDSVRQLVVDTPGLGVPGRVAVGLRGYFPTWVPFRKRRGNCVPPAALLLICIMQLEAPGLLVCFYSGDLDAIWRREGFGKIQKEVRRVRCCSVQTGAFFIFFFSLLLLGVTVLGVRVSYLESILLGLCVSPVTSSPSFMLLSRRGQPLPAGLYKAVSGHWAPLICNCIVILWQFHEESLTKSSKFSLQKGPVMSVPCPNSPLCLLSLTAPWLAWCDLVLCVDQRLWCVRATPNIDMKITPSYLNFSSVMNSLNSGAFNILRQLFLKTLIVHFIFLGVSPLYLEKACLHFCIICLFCIEGPDVLSLGIKWNLLSLKDDLLVFKIWRPRVINFW